MQQVLFTIVILSVAATCFAATAIGPAQVHDSKYTHTHINFQLNSSSNSKS